MTRHRSLIPTLAILAIPIALSSAASRAADPPQYIVTQLINAEVPSVDGTSLNVGGWTTGASGTGQYDWGLHAHIASPTGEVTTLDGPPAYTSSRGYVIDASSRIAGVGYVGSTPWLFRYAPGAGYEVNVQLPGLYGHVADMNEQGDMIAGWSAGSGQLVHFMLYTDEDGLLDLDALAGQPVNPRDINNLRQMVGVFGTYPNNHAFLYENGQWTDLGTLGGQSSSAYYAADTGTVVGHAMVADNQPHAFRYTAGGGLEDLQTLDDAVRSTATLASSTGLIVGTYVNAENEVRPFYYRDDVGMQDMGFELVAGVWGVSHVNAYDEMVGMRMDSQYIDHRFYFNPQVGMHELQSLLRDPLPWEIQEIAGLNDAGQILVTGVYQSQLHTALLTPVWTGDANCDRAVSFGDINAFVQMLTDPEAWQAAHPTCALANGDINGNGTVGFDDINPFVALLSGN